MNQTQELYWCMCNHCLIKNQGVPYNQIRLYIDTTCRKHNCAHGKLFKKCTRYGWIKPVEGACYPTYPCPPDCDVAQHFLSWLSANASEDIVRLNLYLKSRHRHHVDPGAGNHTAGHRQPWITAAGQVPQFDVGINPPPASTVQVLHARQTEQHNLQHGQQRNDLMADVQMPDINQQQCPAAVRTVEHDPVDPRAAVEYEEITDPILARRLSCGGELPNSVPPELLARQPGPDGGVVRRRSAKRSSHMVEAADSEDVERFLIGLLLLKAKQPGLGHDGVKRVLELVSGIQSLKEEFRDSLPDSFRSLLGTLEKEFGMEISLEIVYDICPLCYTVYRCEHKDCLNCPECSSPRYSCIGGRKKARQQIVVRSLTDLISRMFKNKALAQWSDYHAAAVSTDGSYCDFQDGAAYQNAMKDERFRNEPCNQLAGLIADGVQPHADDSKYSMWPIAITFFNFPPWMRYLPGLTSILTVVPGSRIPASKLDLQPVLAIFKDQLDFLDVVGVRVYDAFRQRHFRCYVRLAQVISDIRGTEKLFRLPATPAKYGHFFQWIKGHRCCRKTIFMEGYTLLPLDHPLRPYLARLKSMVAGDTEYDPQSISVPTIRTHEQARAGVLSPPASYAAEESVEPVISYATSTDNFRRLLPDWNANKDDSSVSQGYSEEEGSDSDCDSDDSASAVDRPRKRRRVVQHTGNGDEEPDSEGELGFEDEDEDEEGVDNPDGDQEPRQLEAAAQTATAAAVPVAKAKAVLLDAPGFDFRLHCGYDSMHSGGGSIQDTFVKCMQSLRFTATVKSAETELGRFTGDSRPWHAGPDSLAALQTGLNEIKASTDSRIAGSRILRLISSSKKNKMHTMHFLASPYGRYLVSGMTDVGVEQRAAYCQLLHAFNCIQRKQFTAAELAEAEGELILAVCMVQAFLPVNELDLKLISLLDLIRKIRNTGPLWVTSMFVYEGIWATIVKYGTNKAAPEVTMLRSFADYELAVYAYWKDPERFDLYDLTQLTVEYAKKVSLRYRVPTQPSVTVDIQPKGVPLPALDIEATVELRLMMHRYYMADNELEYAATFHQYAACNGIQQPDNLTATALHTLLINWNKWATQQEQQQQLQQTQSSAAAPRAGRAKRGRPKKVVQRQQLQPEDISRQLLISPMMSTFSYTLYPKVIIGGFKFVSPGHKRDREFGWALLRRWDDGSSHMCFMKIKAVVCHTDYTNTQRELLYGQLHSSKQVSSSEGGIAPHAAAVADLTAAAADADELSDVRIDPVIGMPVFSNKPDEDSIDIVDCNQVAEVNFSVVQHLTDPDLLVALHRDPIALHAAVSLPSPGPRHH